MSEWPLRWQSGESLAPEPEPQIKIRLLSWGKWWSRYADALGITSSRKTFRGGGGASPMWTIRAK
jgi:hypothetical protein